VSEPSSGGQLPLPASLAGSYRCSAEGLTIELRLEPDGRFVQRFSSDGTDVPEEDGLPNGTRRGRWALEEGGLRLFEKPTRAPELRLVTSGRDRSVWMRVEVREPDGTPAPDLLVGQGEEANPISSVTNGIVVVPRSYSFEPGLRRILRAGDELPLASFTVGRTGPNSFRYEYRPSEVEPFSEQAMVAGGGMPAIVVPLGIGGAVLRRTK
jgi:hypothetical protein